MYEKTIYILDVISWKGEIQTSQPFESRLAYFDLIFPIFYSNSYNLRKVLYFPITMEILRALYEENFGYNKDGLLFIHKDSLYIHGVNPNVVIWQDQQTASNFDSMKSEDFSGIGNIRHDGSIFSA